jgi:mutator protein MutT
MKKRAAAVIVKDGSVLLMQRYTSKQGKFFVFPGGLVEAGETEEQAMIREVREELSIVVLKFKFLFEWYNPYAEPPYEPKQEYYYLVTDFSGQVELGGEEKEFMTENNQYLPVWVKLTEIEKLENLYPETAKQKVLSSLQGIG